jgi:hypothetical protein
LICFIEPAPPWCNNFHVSQYRIQQAQMDDKDKKQMMTTAMSLLYSEKLTSCIKCLPSLRSLLNNTMSQHHYQKHRGGRGGLTQHSRSTTTRRVFKIKQQEETEKPSKNDIQERRKQKLQVFFENKNVDEWKDIHIRLINVFSFFLLKFRKKIKSYSNNFENLKKRRNLIQ